jgi:glycosyltransferase involved in cell wall biosynthesis
MIFHVVGLPHTQTTKQYSSCAFTEKVRRFCIMMKSLGHTVYLYAGEQNEAPCDELITCITEEQRKEAVGNNHYTSASFDTRLPHWQIFNSNVIQEIKKRAGKKDFLCFIGGTSHKPIADALPEFMSVEFGIGYGATFAKYRVWESYAWMHSNYAGYKDPTSVDGLFYDEVIPGYIDAADFQLQENKKDYYLFIGRLIDRKGYNIAVEACRLKNKRLIIAGPGNPPEYGEYVGVVGPEERSKLMGGAIATFVPTIYLEPFGNVVVESQMCGTPTITTDWGAFTETNINGLTGYRCRTLKDFCEAMENVKNLDSKLIRQRAIDNYSLESIAPKYDKYFNNLLTLWDGGWYSYKDESGII